LEPFDLTLSYSLKSLDKVISNQDEKNVHDNNGSNAYSVTAGTGEKEYRLSMGYNWTLQSNPLFGNNTGLALAARYTYKKFTLDYNFSQSKSSEGELIKSVPRSLTNSISLIYIDPKTFNSAELNYLYSDNSSITDLKVDDNLSQKFSIKMKYTF